VPTLDPLEFHRYLLRVHQLDMGLRFRMVEGLLAMEEGGIYSLLGCSSILQYAQRYFGLARTAAYEALQTARALRDLPRTREAFLQGFPYSRVALVCAVAAADTEEEWLALAKDTSVKKLKLEVRDAKEKNRKRPRKGQYGLPGVRTRLPFDFAPEEHELLANALKKVAKELSGSLGGKEVEPKAALLYLAQLALKSNPGTLEGRVEDDGQSIYHLIYHRCLDCHRDFLLTEDGAVEVPRAVVDAIEPSAEKETIAPEEEVPPDRTEGRSPESILSQNREGADLASQPLKVGARQGAALPAPQTDKPNSPQFRRRLLLRDGCVCSNPMCGRRLHLQGHHLLARGKGGRTAFYNETAVCPTCHSLVELGYLKVEGDPIRGLVWTPRGDSVVLDLEAAGEAVAAIPRVVAAVPAAGNPGNGVSGRADKPSGRPDRRNGATTAWPGASADDLNHLEDCVLALRTLGAARVEAIRSARRAFEKLREEGKPIATEPLIKLACRY
jgi:hypothetical protein